jgi:hypothetical protein
VALLVTLTVTGAAASRSALLADAALAAVRGSVTCLSGAGVVAGSVLGMSTLDGITAGAQPQLIPAGLPGNVAQPAPCVGGAASPPAATSGNASATQSTAITLRETIVAPATASSAARMLRALQGTSSSPLAPLLPGASTPTSLTPLQAQTLSVLVALSANLDLTATGPTLRAAEMQSWLAQLGNPALTISRICLSLNGACVNSFSPSEAAALGATLGGLPVTSGTQASAAAPAASSPAGTVAAVIVVLLLLAAAAAAFVILRRRRSRSRRAVLAKAAADAAAAVAAKAATDSKKKKSK